MTKIISFFLFTFAGSLLAQNVSVVSLKGTVTAGPSGKLENVKIGSRVADGHTVKSAAGSLAILLYPDGSRIKLKENTELVVHAPSGALERSGLDLVVGAVFSMVAKKPKQNFQVKTPVAVAGVRGTQFFTSYDKKVWMCVQEGEVEMTAESSKSVTVKAGMGIFAEKGKPIAPPEKYAWTKNLNWNMDSDKGDVVDTTVIDDSYNMLKKNYD